MTKLRISADLSLPLEVVTETFAFLARRGGGKTYSAGVMAEEMLAAGAQVVILDPVSRWWGLRVAADGKGRGFDIPILGGPHGDVPLAEHSGELVAKLAIRGHSMILDLSDFDSDAAQRRFVTKFLRDFYDLKRRQEPPTPVHLILEEAEEFVPQDYTGEQTQMIHVIKRVIKLGRNFGIGASLVSQRSADVNKKVLSQIGIMVALQTIAPHDRKAIRDTMEGVGFTKSDELDNKLRTLKVGEAIYWDPGRGEYHILKFRQKITFDTSAGAKAKARAKVEAPTLGESDLAALRAAMETVVREAEENDPARLKARIGALERDLAHAQRQSAPAASGYPKEALDGAYRQGSMDGRRSAIVDYSEGFARTRLDYERITKAISNTSATLHALHAEMVATMQAMADPVAAEAAAPAPHVHLFATGKEVAHLEHAGQLASDATYKSMTGKDLVRAFAGGKLDGPKRRIINALAWLHAVGLQEPEDVQVAMVAGYSHEGTAYTNPRARLRLDGLIEAPAPGRYRLTQEGYQYAETPAAVPTTEELQRRVLEVVGASKTGGGPAVRILKPLLAAYPRSMADADLAAAADYSPNGTAYTNPRGWLRKRGIITGAAGSYRAADWLFLGTGHGRHGGAGYVPMRINP